MLFLGADNEELPVEADAHDAAMFHELDPITCHCHSFGERPVSVETGLERPPPRRGLLCELTDLLSQLLHTYLKRLFSPDEFVCYLI